MLHLILGRSGRGKTAEIWKELRAMEAGEERRFLLVPEQQSHEAERRLCTALGSQSSLKAEVLSFTRLADRVFSVAGGLAERSLDEAGRLLMMHRALEGLEGQLQVYGRVARRPEFLKGLVSTADELKSYGVLPERLGEAAGELDGPAGRKLEELALICATYDGVLSRDVADPRDRLTRLAEAVRRCKFGRGRQFYLDGFVDFTPQEEQVIAALLETGATVTVCLCWDGSAPEDWNTDPFHPTRRAALRLRRLAGSLPVKETVLTEAASDRPVELRHMEEQLFRGERQPMEGPVSALEVFQADGAWSEVEYAAARILRLVRQEGCRWRDIAVAARNFGDYEDAVETVFRRCGIPLFFSRKSDLLEKPVPALLTAALDVLLRGWEYEDVFRYLKTGLTGLSEEDRDRLENYVLTWKLRGNLWTREAPWTLNPGGYGQEADPELLGQLNQLRNAVREPLLHYREAVGKAKNAWEQAAALCAFLEEIRLPQRLEERSLALQQAGEGALAAEYAQLWEILCGALDNMADLLGDRPMDLEEFAALLKLALSQYDVGTIPPSLDQVTAGEASRMQHRSFRCLLLLGASDDSMPMVRPGTGLISDEERERLSDLGVDLSPWGEEQLQWEMNLIYNSLCLPTQRLLISWPARGGDGGVKQPAFFIPRLQELFPELKLIREGDLQGSFRLAAARPALEQAARRLREGDPALLDALEDFPELRQRAERLRSGAGERGRLSPESTRALYGDRVRMSASRAERYRSCHFRYFMEYGLKARPRVSGEYEATDYGSFVHFVLEQVLTELGKDPEGFQKAHPALLRTLADKAVEEYIQTSLHGLEDKSPRFRYLFGRLKSTVYRVVRNVVEELAQSDFKPLALELSFGRQGVLPPVEVEWKGIRLSVSGFVDRVDGWVKDERLYLRVVDYKTGKKSFSLSDVRYGLNIQMLLYLFTLEKHWKDREGKIPTAAGALYLPAREVLLTGRRDSTEAELQRQTDKELVRSGLLLEDKEVLLAMEHGLEEGGRFLPVSFQKGKPKAPYLADAAQMGRLGRHVDRVLQDIARELGRGNVDADPCILGSSGSACDYCEYKAACQFDEERDKKRYLPPVKDVWSELEKDEAGEEGHP